MKKLMAIVLALVMVMSLAACGGGEEKPKETAAASGETQGAVALDMNNIDASIEAAFNASEGKVAIITSTLDQNEEEYRSAQFMVAKYGADRVIHDTMPANYMVEQEQYVSVINKYGSDPDVKCIIVNQAVPGTNPGIDKVLETREKDDLLVIYCTPQENPDDVTTRADITLSVDEIAKGEKVAQQAHDMGCKTMVHYSFPRHMAQVQLYSCRDLMRETCEKLGMEFVDATAPDPQGDAGVTGAQMFILEDVPKMVEKYGKDTAFFSSNCAMQVPLIESCFKEGAYYPLPCCPSPYHGFPSAMGIESPEDVVSGLQATIDAINAKVSEAGLEGHFSTWAVPCSIANTVSSVEYAWLWMAGMTEKVNMEVLDAVFENYVGTDIELTPYTDPESGKSFDNYFVYLQGFLNFGELKGAN